MNRKKIEKFVLTLSLVVSNVYLLSCSNVSKLSIKNRDNINQMPSYISNNKGTEIYFDKNVIEYITFVKQRDSVSLSFYNDGKLYSEFCFWDYKKYSKVKKVHYNMQNLTEFISEKMP